MPEINLGYKKRVADHRKREYQNIYQDPRWKIIVNIKRRDNPLCERCEKKGKTKAMKQVHHKVPFMTGLTVEEIESLAFDIDNTESLCIKCHREADKLLKTFI
jgi:5-methylcytosine-specific restriction endonuclease McrA